MTANIVHAKEKTAEVAQDLQLAGAELHLTNTALERQLPQSAKQGDVGRALEQNAAIETKVQEAADELAVVRDMLDEEVAERTRLEKKIDKMESDSGS